MATINLGVLGPASGKLGGKVFCRMKNGKRCYVRSLPKHYHDAKTVPELRSRDAFTCVMKILHDEHVKRFVRQGFAEAVEELNMSQANYTTRLNKNKIATFNEDSTRYRINYDRLQFSEGAVVRVHGQVALRVDGKLLLSWENNTRGIDICREDLLQVLVYNEDRKMGLSFFDVAERRCLSCRLELPKGWLEERLHIYLSFKNCQGCWSNSSYCCFGVESGRTHWITRSDIAAETARSEDVEFVVTMSEPAVWRFEQSATRVLAETYQKDSKDTPESPSGWG